MLVCWQFLPVIPTTWFNLLHCAQAGGGVCLAGAMEREVKTRQEMVEVLEQGTLLRATGAAACYSFGAAAALPAVGCRV